MADKVEQKQVESTVEEVDKAKVATKNVEETSTTEEEVKSENGNKEAAENGEEETEKSPKESEKNGTEAADKVCKRKSTTATDATDGTPTEGATPEKKAKLDETAEAESNGETEVAA